MIEDVPELSGAFQANAMLPESSSLALNARGASGGLGYVNVKLAAAMPSLVCTLKLIAYCPPGTGSSIVYERAVAPRDFVAVTSPTVYWTT